MDMSVACLSCIPRRGLSASIIMQDGMLTSKRVVRVNDDNISSSTFLSLINSFTDGFKLLKLYVDEHKDVDKVIIECNNLALIKWVKQGYSREQYQDVFIEMLDVLNSIPVQYNLSYIKKPKALMFASEDNIHKEKLSGLF